jgi:hypothetical protein
LLFKKILATLVWCHMPGTPAMQEVQAGGWKFEDSQGKKFSRSYLNQWLGRVAHTCHLNYWGSTNRIAIQPCPGIKRDPI